jgi:hypothetical protein
MNRKILIGLVASTALCLGLIGSFRPAGAQDGGSGGATPNRMNTPAA